MTTSLNSPCSRPFCSRKSRSAARIFRAWRRPSGLRGWALYRVGGQALLVELHVAFIFAVGDFKVALFIAFAGRSGSFFALRYSLSFRLSQLQFKLFWSDWGALQVAFQGGVPSGPFSLLRSRGGGVGGHDAYALHTEKGGNALQITNKLTQPKKSNVAILCVYPG